MTAEPLHTDEVLLRVGDAIGDGVVWDDRELSDEPKPQTAQMLRDFVARTKAEDAAAGPIVARLLDVPPHQREALLTGNAEWRTAGVVRKILEAVDKTNFVDPRMAAAWADLAVAIADTLDSHGCATNTVAMIRSRAHRTRAYVLYTTGSYAESLDELDLTEECLRTCTISEHDAARAGLIRALVYTETERLPEAVELAATARTTFQVFGDTHREAIARATEGLALLYGRRFAEALDVFESLSADPRIDERSRAYYVHDAAICYRELSKLDRSKALFARAVSEFERLGVATMRARARWHLGQVLLAESRYSDAYTLLIGVRTDFEEFGMAQDVALVSIDAAEALLMLERPVEVVQLCQSAMGYFVKAGLAYTQGALTALAYLKEAADAQTLTPKALGEARAYFKVLPKQPDLLFAYSA